MRSILEICTPMSREYLESSGDDYCKPGFPMLPKNSDDV